MSQEICLNELAPSGQPGTESRGGGNELPSIGGSLISLTWLLVLIGLPCFAADSNKPWASVHLRAPSSHQDPSGRLRPCSRTCGSGHRQMCCSGCCWSRLRLLPKTHPSWQWAARNTTAYVAATWPTPVTAICSAALLCLLPLLYSSMVLEQEEGMRALLLEDKKGLWFLTWTGQQIRGALLESWIFPSGSECHHLQQKLRKGVSASFNDVNQNAH